MRRLVVIALLGALLAALAPGSAHAALGLLFSKTSTEPGDVVFVRTGGNGALLEAKKRGETKRWPLRVFMVAKADVDTIRSTRDSRLKALGRLTVDRKGNGRLRFATPNLPPGDYATLIYCRSCARYSNGRALLPGGPFSRPFRVRPALRNCESSVYGELRPGWERDSVRAGPLWLVGVRGYGARAFEPVRPGYYGGVKVLLTVANGVTATISVPPSERGNVTLRYDQALMQGGRGGSAKAALRPRLRRARPAITRTPSSTAGSSCEARVVPTLKSRSEAAPSPCRSPFHSAPPARCWSISPGSTRASGSPRP